MGGWDSAPWDNDSGADWFGDMFDETKLADYVRDTLQNRDVEEDYDEIRAAAAVVLMLGRTYVWPIDTIDEDLTLAVSKLEALLRVPELKESRETISAIKEEIQELRSRCSNGDGDAPSTPPGKKWWAFWK